ncbi:MAG: hypothetical protein HQM16_19165 [Deltaproteobacteria bacterium]|nr:hypothetical protein [Deltaproteobacteria bacterium]
MNRQQSSNDNKIISQVLLEIEAARSHGPQHKVSEPNRQTKLHKLIKAICQEAMEMIPLFVFVPIEGRNESENLRAETLFYDEAYTIWKGLPPLVRTMILRGFVSSNQKGKTLNGNNYYDELVQRAVKDCLKVFIDDVARNFSENDDHMGDSTGLIGFLLMQGLDETVRDKIMHLLFEVYPEYANIVSLWKEDDITLGMKQRTMLLNNDAAEDLESQRYII